MLGVRQQAGPSLSGCALRGTQLGPMGDQFQEYVDQTSADVDEDEVTADDDDDAEDEVDAT